MKKLSAIKSIRAFCTTVCCCGDLEYVRECPDGPAHPVPCPLHPYRMGSNPNISAETKRKASEQMKKRMAKAGVA